MHSSSVLLALASLTSGSLAAYSLVDEWTSKNIFEEWDFPLVRISSDGFLVDCRPID